MKSLFAKLISRIRNNSFIKSVFALATGSVIAQGINFLGMPVIGRLYSPEAMGDYALITANAGTITAISCLGLMTSIMIPKEDEDAKGLVRLISVASCVISFAIILALKIISPYYRFFKQTQTSYDLGLFVLWLFIIFNIISSVCYGYMNRLKKYRAMFWNPIISGSINILLGILFGFFKWGFIGYTSAHIISLMAGIIYSIFTANPFVGISSEMGWLQLLKEYKKFPLFVMPANLIQNLTNQIPVQLIENLYSAGSLGMYSMALRVLSIPSTLLAVPINRVYYQEANERYNKGENIGEFSFKILEANIKIAIIPIMAIVILGKPIFSIFLGVEWADAGTYASIMGLYQLMLFCASCLSGNFVIIRKNSWNLFSSLAILSVESIMAIVYVFFITVPLKVFLITLCLVLTLHLVIVEGLFLTYAGLPLKKYIGFIIKYIAIPYLLSVVLNSFTI